jgi:hypothetical protein
MPDTPIRAGRSPIPAHPFPQPLRAAARLPRAAAQPDPHVDAMHPQHLRPTGKGMSQTVPRAPSDLAPEGNDLRISHEPLPPLLIPPALRSFFTFERRHACPPHHYHEVLLWLVLHRPARQPAMRLPASATTSPLPPFPNTLLVNSSFA